MRTLKREEGQSLLQLALITAVLVSIAALAIDLGYGYLVRRRMQNAADAGALAGARAICLAEPTDVAIAAAKDYMKRNGVRAADIDAGDVKVSGTTVQVHADAHPNTLLAGIFDQPVLDVAAEANAICGRATAACGLWPIAFSLTLWEDVPCGERLVIWDADKDADEARCKVGGEDRPVCDCYECDKDGDGHDDFVMITEAARGWLDFSSVVDPLYPDNCKASGCGASELVCRIRSGGGGRITLPACIPGIRGIKAGAKDDVNARAGETVRIPLYSGTGCPSDSNCSGTSADSFYVTRFGCIEVEGWQQKFRLEPKPAYDLLGYKAISSKAIYVRKSCGGGCSTFCGSTDGEAPEEWELRAVGITK